MTSKNILSRLLPSNTMSPSIYKELRGHPNAVQADDVEGQAGLALDEENLRTRFQDYDYEHEEVFNGPESPIDSENTTFLPNQDRQDKRKGTSGDRLKKELSKSKWLSRSPRLLEDDGDDDVPASLLIEEEMEPGPSGRQPQRQPENTPANAIPIPGPSNRKTRAQWEAAQPHQMLHVDGNLARAHNPIPSSRIVTGTPRDKAMWTWVNVMNLDDFMHEVYTYYRQGGIWCIALQRFLRLCTVAFVVGFSTFLTQCIQYTAIRNSSSLAQVLVPQCTKKMSGFANFAIWLLTLVLIAKLFTDLLDLRRLKRMHDFFLHCLNIPDSDMQTVSWQDIVKSFMDLRDINPVTNMAPLTPEVQKYMETQSKQSMDAHGIANRLMRRDNYLIALFNKEILDLSIPLPFLSGTQLYSKVIEWNLNFCVLDLFFGADGQISPVVLKSSRRRELSSALRSRFLFAGFMNVLFIPMFVVYLLIVYFFKYFNEYQKNPSAIGSRAYTPLAEWKFREFNELPHLFYRRINMSYPFAERYVDQFPKQKTVHLSQFVAFVAGALVSVLAVSTLIDPELFLGFEITKDRTVLFYLGVIGTIWAVAHGMVPPENFVFEPEYALRSVMDYTHYCPPQWNDRLHSDEVRKEFAQLYKMKIVIFLEEVISIILTPFLLWFSLPPCSDRIVDFFREFTIHVDGLGHVCSFAVFKFQKSGVAPVQDMAGDTDALRGSYYATKHGKMVASYWGFVDNYNLNPKTGIPGHVPPGTRQHVPPPAFPGLLSHSRIGADMHSSRAGRDARIRGTGAGRTPRFAASGSHASPIPSLQLDPHRHPSASGFGGTKSAYGQSARSRYHASRDIMEDPEEEEDPGDSQNQGQEAVSQEGFGVLGESKWEISPTKGVSQPIEDDEEAAGNAGGVLGLLYQFQKAHADGRGHVNI